MKQVKKGNIQCIVFDEVSRMSRDKEEGFKLYKELFSRGVELVFLKEKHINTSVYQNAINNQINLEFKSGDIAADNLMKTITKALNDYVMVLAEKQIGIAFERAQEEVELLHRRTSEGMKIARITKGSQIGRIKGKKYPSKKSIKSKRIIAKYYMLYGENLKAKECMKLCNITRTTFYRYIKEISIK